MVNSKRFLTPKKRGGAKGSRKRMRGGMQPTIANFSATQLEMIQFLINADLNHSGTISKSEFDITLEFRKNLNAEEEKKFWDAFGLSDNQTYDGFLQFLREKKSEKIVKDGKVGKEIDLQELKNAYSLHGTLPEGVVIHTEAETGSNSSSSGPGNPLSAKQSAATPPKSLPPPAAPLAATPSEKDLIQELFTENQSSSEGDNKKLDQNELTQLLKKKEDLKKLLTVLTAGDMIDDNDIATKENEPLGELAEHIINSFDKDGDKELDLDEFQKGIEEVQIENKDVILQDLKTEWNGKFTNLQQTSIDDTATLGNDYYSVNSFFLEESLRAKMFTPGLTNLIQNYLRPNAAFNMPDFTENYALDLAKTKIRDTVIQLAGSLVPDIREIIRQDLIITEDKKPLPSGSKYTLSLKWENVDNRLSETNLESILNFLGITIGHPFRDNSNFRIMGGKVEGKVEYYTLTEDGITLGDSEKISKVKAELVTLLDNKKKQQPEAVSEDQNPLLSADSKKTAEKLLNIMKYLNFKHFIGDVFTTTGTVEGSILDKYLTYFKLKSESGKVLGSENKVSLGRFIKNTIEGTDLERIRRQEEAIPVEPKQFYSIFERKLGAKSQIFGVPNTLDKYKKQEIAFLEEQIGQGQTVKISTMTSEEGGGLTKKMKMAILKDADTSGDEQLSSEELSEYKKHLNNPNTQILHEFIRFVGLLICVISRFFGSNETKVMGFSFRNFKNLGKGAKTKDSDFNLGSFYKRFGQALIMFYHIVIDPKQALYASLFGSSGYMNNSAFKDLIPNLYGTTNVELLPTNVNPGPTNVNPEYLKQLFGKLCQVYYDEGIELNPSEDNLGNFFSLFCGLAFYRLKGKASMISSPYELIDVRDKIGEHASRMKHITSVGIGDKSLQEYYQDKLFKFHRKSYIDLRTLTTNQPTSAKDPKLQKSEYADNNDTAKMYLIEPLIHTSYTDSTMCVNTGNDKIITGGKNSKKRRSQVVNSKKRQSTSQQKQTPKRKTAQQQSKTKSKSPQQQQKRQQKKQQQKQSQQKKNTQVQKKSSKNGKK